MRMGVGWDWIRQVYNYLQPFEIALLYWILRIKRKTKLKDLFVYPAYWFKFCFKNCVTSLILDLSCGRWLLTPLLHRSEQDTQKLSATSVTAVWSRKTASNLLVCVENYVFVFVTKLALVSVIYFPSSSEVRQNRIILSDARMLQHTLFLTALRCRCGGPITFPFSLSPPNLILS